MTREQMEAAGYGYHHSTDDGKYLIMGNGTQAFAIAAEQREQENYMRTAELSTEQNYNMIDGQINNTPSVDELEEKAKRGEVISLSALAAAVKVEDKVYLWFSQPNGTHCLRERDKRLFALLPYKTLYLPSVKERHGVFAFISKDERRELPLRKQHPSVRAQLKEEQSKKSAAPKKAAAKAKDNDLEV